MKRKLKGMTLIEVVIALAVYAVLGLLMTEIMVCTNKTIKNSSDLDRRLSYEAKFADNRISMASFGGGPMSDAQLQNFTFNCHEIKADGGNTSFNLNFSVKDSLEHGSGVTPGVYTAYLNPVTDADLTNYSFLLAGQVDPPNDTLAGTTNIKLQFPEGESFDNIVKLTDATIKITGAYDTAHAPVISAPNLDLDSLKRGDPLLTITLDHEHDNFYEVPGTLNTYGVQDISIEIKGEVKLKNKPTKTTTDKLIDADVQIIGYIWNSDKTAVTPCRDYSVQLSFENEQAAEVVAGKK